MILEEIKEKLSEIIEMSRGYIENVGDIIAKNPELGYCEEKTSLFIRKEFEKLGIEYEYPYAMTGIKAKLKGRNHNYNVCIIGEMDAVICEGKASHKCGHNAQIAYLLGVAMAFKKSGVMKELDGDITFLAVPAEEFIDLDLRRKLKKEGKISYFGGKQQLIAEGVFDDIDMAMMMHAQGNECEPKVYVDGSNLGFIAKTIVFKGKAAHGSMPYDGVNALNAAALSILGIHANRETFREEDKIKIHPIITKGGDVVNSVPDEVQIDTYVRGASFEAIKKGDIAVERAVHGASQMVGATAEIENVPGYLPLKECIELSEIFKSNAKDIVGEKNIVYNGEITGSSDIGDLSYLIPTIQPSIGGFSGGLHSNEFEISDKNSAYIIPAKILSHTAAELLYNNAEKAKKVKDAFKMRMSKDEYIKYLNQED